MNIKDIVFRDYPYIIAEIGSNLDYTAISTAYMAIRLAKLAGADAVKFQLFSHKDLYGYDNKEQDKITCMPKEWIPLLKTYSKSKNIDFMCSAFSIENYEYLNSYIEIHKVASTEACSIHILDYLKTTKKPVLLSAGGNWEETDILKSIGRLDKNNLIILLCTAEYPARRLCVRNIDLYYRLYNLPVGFSDHSIDVFDIPFLAKELGACVIEKHFNPLKYARKPDSGHALDLIEFSDMVRYLRGDISVYSSAQSQLSMVSKHNKRIIALKDINIGDKYIFGDNLGLYRIKMEYAKGGFSGHNLPIFEGKIASKSYEEGDVIDRV